MQGRRFCSAISWARQVLLHRDRVVRSSLHRGIVCHNHAVVTIDSGNSIRRTHESGQFQSQYRHSRLPPCTAPLRRVQIVRGRGSRIEKTGDAFSRKHFPSLPVLCNGLLLAALHHSIQEGVVLILQTGVVSFILLLLRVHSESVRRSRSRQHSHYSVTL